MAQVGIFGNIFSQMRTGKTPAVSNRLLDALPRRTLRDLLSRLEPVTLNFGEVLLAPGERIQYVFFPDNCVVSLLTEEEERAVEVGLVGHEGMVGIQLALGVDVSPVRAIVQGTGTALRMHRARFLKEFQAHPAWQRELYRYSHALMSQVTQISACNRLHRIEARLARWLLMTRDRLRSPQFPLTHKFLGFMLGVRRVGVTQAAGELQRKKLITYSRGNIRIIDPQGLEAASCRCYRIVKNLH
ncbi:MAG: Crp/Fnr family transcriptional regulator [Burkholderiales bacterium]